MLQDSRDEACGAFGAYWACEVYYEQSWHIVAGWAYCCRLGILLQVECVYVPGEVIYLDPP